MKEYSQNFVFQGSFFSGKTAPMKVEQPEFNKYGYRNKRLYKERVNLCKLNDKNDHAKERLFQIIADYQYQRYAEIQSVLKKNKIVLTCIKEGGCGDIAQTFLCAELIKRKFPDYKIKIVVGCKNYDQEQVKEMFPQSQFEMQFLSPSDYCKQEAEIKELAKEGDCILGIAVPITSPNYLKPPLYRQIKEYGHGDHFDVVKSLSHILAMGFAPHEEGINFPFKNHRFLYNLQSQWLKNALQINSAQDETTYLQNRHLYHAYVPHSELWPIQIITLYSIAAIEKDHSNPIDIFFPLKYSLEELINWGALKLDYLEKNNIGQLILITPEKTEQKIIGDGKGKTIKLISGFIQKEDMEAIEEHSQPFFACTGNVSLSAGFVHNKLPFYGKISTQLKILEFWTEEIKKMGSLKNLEELLNLLNNQIEEREKIYDKFIPVKRSWYQSDPSYDLADENSVPRKSMRELGLLLPRYADKVAHLYLNTSLLQEAQIFNTHLLENFSFEPRLIEMTYRGLFLKQFPVLGKIEEELCLQFKQGKITEESVVEQLNRHLDTTIADLFSQVISSRETISTL